MGATVFSQVWKAYDVWRLRDDLGDADRPVLRRSAPWSEDVSALYVDSLINGFPLTPLVVQSCRDAQGKSRLRVLDGWQRVEAVVAFGEDRLRLPGGFVFRGETWGGETVEAGGMTLSQVRERYPYVERRFDTALIPVAHVKGDDAVLGEFVARLHGEGNCATANDRGGANE